MRKRLYGPPGTGKTAALLAAVESELESGTKPNKIGFFAFTRRGASEAALRASSHFGQDIASELIYFRTLHSLCYELVEATPDQIMAPSDYKAINDYFGFESAQSITWSSGGNAQKYADRLLQAVNLSRARCEPLFRHYHLYDDGIIWQDLANFDAGLAYYKKETNKLEFHDLLERVLEDPDKLPCLDLLIIDEAQDLSTVQWNLVDELAKRAKKTIIAGDDDQAIYVWAGADVKRFVDFKVDENRVLNKSYRVPRKIQEVSNNIISRIHNRVQKDWGPRDEEGVVRSVDSLLEVDFSSGEWLVLARNMLHLLKITEMFWDKGYIYTRSMSEDNTSTSIDTALWRHAELWSKFAREEPVRWESLSPVLRNTRYSGVKGERGKDVCAADLGLKNLGPWFVEFIGVDMDARDYMRRCLSNKEHPNKARIHLSTIHSAKGAECDNVVLLTDMAVRTYNNYYQDEDAEHRVFYVGASRAKQSLTIVEPTTQKRYVVQ